MNKLIKIWLNKLPLAPLELRLDWSNGWHQRFEIHDNTPEGIARILQLASEAIRFDAKHKNL